MKEIVAKLNPGKREAFGQKLAVHGQGFECLFMGLVMQKLELGTNGRCFQARVKDAAISIKST